MCFWLFDEFEFYNGLKAKYFSPTFFFIAIRRLHLRRPFL